MRPLVILIAIFLPIAAHAEPKGAEQCRAQCELTYSTLDARKLDEQAVQAVPGIVPFAIRQADVPKKLAECKADCNAKK